MKRVGQEGENANDFERSFDVEGEESAPPSSRLPLEVQSLVTVEDKKENPANLVRARKLAIAGILVGMGVVGVAAAADSCSNSSDSGSKTETSESK